MSNVIVAIRAAEGGDDAKLLVQEQFRIYGRLCSRRRL
jgi:protein subunit release factor A